MVRSNQWRRYVHREDPAVEYEAQHMADFYLVRELTGQFLGRFDTEFFDSTYKPIEGDGGGE